jgi:hypothetical protein
MKIVSIYEPQNEISAKLKDSKGHIFFANVLFIAVTEDGKLIPCVGGSGKQDGKNIDVVVSLAENYDEMTVE